MTHTDIYQLFELSPVPMWVFDSATLRFLEVNIAATNAYGYTKAEFLQMTINDIRPKEDIKKVKKIVKDNIKSGLFYQNSFEHLHKNGKLMYVEIASNCIAYQGHQARLVQATDVTEKREAQLALLRSEQRFAALVEDGSDMITILNQNYQFKYVSPASKKAFGNQAASFLGKEVVDYVHPDDLPIIIAEMEQLKHHKRVQLSPFRYRDFTGGWIWLETRISNLLDDPAVAGFVCTSKDISKRITNENLLKENIARYHLVAKATSDIIWDCDFTTNTILWNKAMQDILGYQGLTQTSFVWWKEHIHPEDRKRVINHFEASVTQNFAKWEDEYRFRCANGRYKYVLDRRFLLLNDAGEAQRMIGAMQDVTAKKEEENWSKLLESVVINTTDGVMITDASSQPKVIYVNDAILAMSGYSKRELLGRHPYILLADENLNEIDKLNKAIADKVPCKVEVFNYNKKGERYDVSVSLNPVFGADGKLVRWVSIQRDVSVQHQYINEIELQNKKLNEIRWIQSHVARAPLARIMSLVELLAYTPDEIDRKELMDLLLNAANELDQIISTIANQSKSSA